MLRFRFSSVVLLGLVALAPPVKAQSYTWTGLYAGVNAGVGWAESRTDQSQIGGWAIAGFGPAQMAATGSNTLSPSGFIGGVQAGANWQIGKIVVGAEVDASWADLSASRSISAINANSSTIGYDTNTKIETFYTVRPRIGYAFGNALVYFTGGLAIAQQKFAHQQTCQSSGLNCGALPNFDRFTSEKLAVGWVIGGGLEYALHRTWTLKAEYLFADLGERSGTTTNTTSNFFGIAVRNDITMQVMRAGLNYRF